MGPAIRDRIAATGGSDGPTPLNDILADAPRFIQKTKGYRATVSHGQVIPDLVKQ
jgi:hypothetical protein